MVGANRRFEALDGLRAWAAWTVVFVHIAWQAELYKTGRFWGVVNQCGLWSVLLFTVISGFSIANLVLLKEERYAVYICRRFFRLYPAYLLALILSLLSYAVAQHQAGRQWFDEVHGDTYRAFLREPVMNLLAHLTMLHGLLPDNILYLSPVVILPPGWSISLEWQFYIIAPAVIAITRAPKGLFAVSGLSVLTAIAYRKLLEPLYAQPSCIMQFGFVFVIGIATRLALFRSDNPRIANWLAIACLAAGLVSHQPWLAIWGIVILYISGRNLPIGRLQRPFFLLLDRALSSKAASYLGDRSYSTYVLHWPIVLLTGTAATGYYDLTSFKLASTLLFAVPLTLLLQEFVYSAVERPSKKAASWVVRRLDRERSGRAAGDPAPQGIAPASTS